MAANIIDLFPPLKCQPFKVRECLMICLLSQHHLALCCVCAHIYGSIKLTFIFKFIKSKFKSNPTTDWIYFLSASHALFTLSQFLSLPVSLPFCLLNLKRHESPKRQVRKIRYKKTFS